MRVPVGRELERLVRPGRSPASNECKDPRSSQGAVRPRSGRMNSGQAYHEANRKSSVPTTFRGQVSAAEFLHGLLHGLRVAFHEGQTRGHHTLCAPLGETVSTTVFLGVRL